VTQFIMINLLIATMAITSCASFSGLGPQVVEKSKEARPPWVNGSDDSLAEEGDKLLYIKEQSHLKDLPLGVKDTQFQALQDSRDLLQKKVLDHIKTVSSESGISVVNNAQMTSTVADAVRTSHNEFARIQDIYYEKINDRSIEDKLEQDYYKVFVRVEYPKTQIDVLLKNISMKFSGSKLPDLGKIAGHLEKLEWKLYSH